MIDVGFSVDIHDRDGDIVEECILLHFNDTFLLKLDNLTELDAVIEQLTKIRNEIKNNYCP